MRRLIAALAVVVLSVSVAFAAAVKDYQVTGPVLELKDDMIVVQKGDERWEVARDKDTKVTGDLKVGSKVTIKYKMKATVVEVKEEAKKDTKKESKEPKKK